jgi:hypothetical protein
MWRRSKSPNKYFDIFDQEPTPQNNPLLTLPNFIAAPPSRTFSASSSKPIRYNVVNKEVLD